MEASTTSSTLDADSGERGGHCVGDDGDYDVAVNDADVARAGDDDAHSPATKRRKVQDVVDATHEPPAPALALQTTAHPYAHLPITKAAKELGLDKTVLERRNAYAPFDDHAVFYDEVPDDVELPPGTRREHLYIVDGVPWRDSCTGFLGSFFSPFDEVAVSTKMAASSKRHTDESDRYYRMTAAEIRAEWKLANQLGTRMHLCIELFYNGAEQPTHPDFQRPEYAHHFKNFHRDYVEGKLEPFRTEWTVFDRTYELVGQIDGVFRRLDADDPYALVLYDWKRTHKIEAAAYQNATANGPFAGLPDAKFWKYAMQLNTYKFIIERNTPYRVVEMVLLRCHPDADNYDRIVVPDLQAYVRRAAEVRWRQIVQYDLDALVLKLKQSPPTDGAGNDNDSAQTTTASHREAQGDGTAAAATAGDAEPSSPLDALALAVQVRRRFEAHLAAMASGAQPSHANAPGPLPPITTGSVDVATRAAAAAVPYQFERRSNARNVASSASAAANGDDPRRAYVFDKNPRPASSSSSSYVSNAYGRTVGTARGASANAVVSASSAPRPAYSNVAYARRAASPSSTVQAGRVAHAGTSRHVAMPVTDPRLSYVFGK